MKHIVGVNLFCEVGFQPSTNEWTSVDWLIVAKCFHAISGREQVIKTIIHKWDGVGVNANAGNIV